MYPIKVRLRNFFGQPGYRFGKQGGFDEKRYDN